MVPWCVGVVPTLRWHGPAGQYGARGAEPRQADGAKSKSGSAHNSWQQRQSLGLRRKGHHEHTDGEPPRPPSLPLTVSRKNWASESALSSLGVRKCLVIAGEVGCGLFKAAVVVVKE